MKIRLVVMAALAVVSLLQPLASPAAPLGTAFTYQGRLDQLGVPANDTCSFQFGLWDAVTSGTRIGNVLTVSGLVITDGTFTTQLDFGAGAFAGQARWLEIAVKCGAEPTYTTLSPRQALTPSPHALFSQNGGASQWATGADGHDLTYSGGGVGITGGSSPFPSGKGVFIEGTAAMGLVFAYDYDTLTPKNLILNSPGGRVGVGTTAPAGKLSATSSAEAAIVGVHTGAWVGVYGESQSSLGVYGKSVSSVGVQGETGGTSAGVLGLATTANGWGGYFRNTAGGFSLVVDGKSSLGTLELRGGADIVEGFTTGDDAIEPGTVVVIDEHHPGALRVSTDAYDRRVAGIVSGAGGISPGLRLGQEGVLDGETPVAMSGRVYVRCSDENGPVRPGDLLTTAATAGYAMRASDASRSHGAVLGKSMTALESGTGLVLVLVNLQ